MNKDNAFSLIVFNIFEFKDELMDFPAFIKVLTAFQEFYGLTEYNKKQLDRYLWQLGKKFFPKKY